MKWDKIITYVLITCLLLLAASLRLYHPFQIPLTYDELASLFRAKYSGFTTLINQGVMAEDVHPAGIPVLLYYWLQVVGDNVLYIKLPFIVFGILSVFYIFKLGEDWFNPTVGLICAAYIATLQYTIMHSQEIRQYSSGLFFSLAMVYHWNRLVFKPEKRFDLHWVLYIFFSALCAYTHYFSLFFAAIAGFTGLFFIRKRYSMRYIAAGIMIFVLYIPHLHILLYQFTVNGGGVDWLSKPGNNFIISYLEYVFHSSPYVYGIAAALFVFGLIHSIVTKRVPSKFFFISFAWFAIQFLTAFFYSIYKHPVIEYRVLLFSLPFLLFVIFGLLPDMHFLLKTSIIGIICTANILTLIYTNRYYELYYQEPMHKIYSLTDSVCKTMGKDGTLRFIDCNGGNKAIEHYFVKRDHLDSTFVLLDSTMDKISMIDYLEDHPRRFLSYGSTADGDVANIPIFLNYYPNIIKRYNLSGGNFYIFSSLPGNHNSLYSFESKEDFEGQAIKGWDIGGNPPLMDSLHFSGSHSYKMDSLREYGPTFNSGLKDMIRMRDDVITVSAEIYPTTKKMDGAYLVSLLEVGGKTIDWRGTSLETFIPLGVKNKWVKVYHAIKLSDINLDSPDVKVKIFIWNKGKRNFLLDDLEVKTLNGNPNLYWLTEQPR